MPPIDLIAFDADDTLWENETKYVAAQERLVQLLAPYAPAEQVNQAVPTAEIDNLPHYGYGIKAWALSMIEAAIDLSGGEVTAAEVQAIIDLARQMIHSPVELLDGVADTLARLSPSRRLMLITKGDLFEQEAKIARSGVAEYFAHVEIISEKTPATYRAILDRHAIDPAHFLMVGNSMKSDVLPVVELGGRAVYVPHAVTWVHETVPEPDEPHDRIFRLDHVGLLPALLEKLESDTAPA